MATAKTPKKYVIPKNLVPFSKMEKADKKSFAVCEYENDVEFKDLLVNPDEYIEILKKLLLVELRRTLLFLLVAMDS